MDFDILTKQIQSWTNRVPLIILGSGASVPFNLPSMWTLGEHIKKSISFTESEDQLQFDEFKDSLNKSNDLETALSELTLRPKVLDEIVFKTWELINKSDIEAYEQFISKTVDFPLAELTKHLTNTAGKKLTIVTTNYDRLAEYAASLAGAIIYTGYAQNYIGHFSSAIHTNNLNSLNGYSGQVNIWKVHGSLDWFKTHEEETIQIPLRNTVPKHFKPLIVTPGISKYYETHNEPYRTILTQADSSIEAANGFLCIGYGFNDTHVQPKLIAQIKKDKPIIVITKQLSDETKQSIIGNNCKNYILMEEVNGKDTKLYSSFGEHIYSDVSYWSLSEYLKLIK